MLLPKRQNELHPRVMGKFWNSAVETKARRSMVPELNREMGWDRAGLTYKRQDPELDRQHYKGKMGEKNLNCKALQGSEGSPICINSSAPPGSFSGEHCGSDVLGVFYVHGAAIALTHSASLLSPATVRKLSCTFQASPAGCPIPCSALRCGAWVSSKSRAQGNLRSQEAAMCFLPHGHAATTSSFSTNVA